MKPSIHATKVGQKIRNINIPFSIREDLSSERVAEYRALIIRGIEGLRCDHDTTVDEHEMIDRLLWDHIEDPRLAQLLEIKRTIARTIEAMATDSCGDIIVELEAVDHQLGQMLKAESIE